MSPSVQRVGIVGLGRMGLPMARHLVRAGFAVHGFDLDSERTAALADAGGAPLSSVGDVARRSDAVLLMVADDAQVKEVALGFGGVIEVAAPGTIVIISSTVKPSTCQEVAVAGSRRSIGVLDAPVCKGQRSAEAGALTVFVGGAQELFQRCRPIFEAFATQMVHIGTRVGSGQVAKLANNLLLWAGVVASHEVLALAERLDVAPSRVREALQHGSADSWALRELHQINLTWPHKDLAQAMEVAAASGATLPLASRVTDLIRGLTREELRRLCALEGSEDPPDR